jgi:hypothetical protein
MSHDALDDIVDVGKITAQQAFGEDGSVSK